jgi:hypothetical protein
VTPHSPFGDHSAHGLDQPYAGDRPRAKEELESTLAGAAKRPPVPRDDTEMKNPDGDLQNPAAMPRR